MVGCRGVSCNDDGSYDPTQCYASTGYCWCVDADGNELPGSRAGPAEDKVACTATAAKSTTAKSTTEPVARCEAHEGDCAKCLASSIDGRPCYYATTAWASA